MFIFHIYSWSIILFLVVFFYEVAKLVFAYFEKLISFYVLFLLHTFTCFYKIEIYWTNLIRILDKSHWHSNNDGHQSRKGIFFHKFCLIQPYFMHHFFNFYFLLNWIKSLFLLAYYFGCKLCFLHVNCCLYFLLFVGFSHEIVFICETKSFFNQLIEF